MKNQIVAIIISVILAIGYAAPYFSETEKERAIAVQQEITKVQLERLKWEREKYVPKTRKQIVAEQMIEHNRFTMGTKFTGEDIKAAIEALGEK